MDGVAGKLVAYFSHNAHRLVRDVLLFGGWFLLVAGGYTQGYYSGEVYYLLLILGLVVYSVVVPGWKVPWTDEEAIAGRLIGASEEEIEEATSGVAQDEEPGWKRIDEDESSSDGDESAATDESS